MKNRKTKPGKKRLNVKYNRPTDVINENRSQNKQGTLPLSRLDSNTLVVG